MALTIRDNILSTAPLFMNSYWEFYPYLHLQSKVRLSTEDPSLAINWISSPFGLWHKLLTIDFKVHSSSLKNGKVWDVRMFQETKCAICKKKIRAPRRDEPWLQVMKDFWMKHLQRAWKTHWVSWRDSSRNNWKWTFPPFLVYGMGKMLLSSCTTIPKAIPCACTVSFISWQSLVCEDEPSKTSLWLTVTD